MSKEEVSKMLSNMTSNEMDEKSVQEVMSKMLSSSNISKDDFEAIASVEKNFEGRKFERLVWDNAANDGEDE